MVIRTVMADPPWLERGAGQIKRGADRHYPLLPTIEIPIVMKSCPYWSEVAEDAAHLYLWATNNFLEDGLYVMRELGFRYITNLVWVKDRPGLGQYWRGQHELLLFGVRGEGKSALVRRDRDDLTTSPIYARRGEHSAKPEASYERIEARSRGPYLEVFARSTRPGWTAWGNEVST